MLDDLRMKAFLRSETIKEWPFLPLLFNILLKKVPVSSVRQIKDIQIKNKEVNSVYKEDTMPIHILTPSQLPY